MMFRRLARAIKPKGGSDYVKMYLFRIELTKNTRPLQLFAEVEAESRGKAGGRVFAHILSLTTGPAAKGRDVAKLAALAPIRQAARPGGLENVATYRSSTGWRCGPAWRSAFGISEREFDSCSG